MKKNVFLMLSIAALISLPACLGKKKECSSCTTCSTDMPAETRSEESADAKEVIEAEVPAMEEEAPAEEVAMTSETESAE